MLFAMGYDLEGELGTITIADDRTIGMIENYIFYRSAPWKVSKSKIWFDTYMILNNVMKERLI